MIPQTDYESRQSVESDCKTAQLRLSLLRLRRHVYSSVTTTP
jgi:hypothetical protein